MVCACVRCRRYLVYIGLDDRKVRVVLLLFDIKMALVFKINYVLFNYEYSFNYLKLNLCNFSQIYGGYVLNKL